MLQTFFVDITTGPGCEKLEVYLLRNDESFIPSFDYLGSGTSLLLPNENIAKLFTCWQLIEAQIFWKLVKNGKLGMEALLGITYDEELTRNYQNKAK